MGCPRNGKKSGVMAAWWLMGEAQETDAVDWSQTVQGQEFGFGSKYNRKALKSLRQRSKMVRFLF